MGQVVGLAETSTPDPYGQDTCGFGTHLICRPFVWQDGVMSALPTLGGTSGEAFGVNHRGQIVGVAQTASPDPTCAPPHVLGFEAVLWEHGQVQQQFPTVSGDPDGYANAINHHGQVVGGTGDCEQDYANQPQHAVLWQNGTATDLGNLGGTTNNLATDINGRGQVVGKSNVSGDATFHAFLWQNGTMADLGTLAGDFASQANAINKKGQLVGFSCDASGNCRAFLWQHGVMTDLNTLVQANSPLYALEATWINPRGVITGYALQLSTGQIHAFLATPITDDVADAATPAVRGESSESPKITVSENIRKSLQQRPGLGRARLGVIHAQ
jgi:probable HAF family extracellular repeat protein